MEFKLERPIMKKIQFLAVCGLVLALGAVARAETAAKPAAVTVVGISGEARYSIDGKAWHPLVIGKILHQNAIIETAANSSADLVLSGSPVPIPEDTSSPQSMSMLTMAPDPNIRGYVSYKPMTQQNVIHMFSQTMLAVDQLTEINTGADTVGNTELDLRAGKIFANVKKMSAESQFIIKLPNGVAGIRGSSGCVDSSGSVQWYLGQIVLSLVAPNSGPNVIVIHGGFAYDATTGQVIPIPPKILAALHQLGVYSETLYAQVVSLPNDVTKIYISPTQGTGGVITIPTPPPDDDDGP